MKNILFIQTENFFQNIIQILKSDYLFKITTFDELLIDPSFIDRSKISSDQVNAILIKKKKIIEFTNEDIFFKKYFIEFLDIFCEHHPDSFFASKKWGTKKDYYELKNFFMFYSQVIYNLSIKKKFDIVIFGRYPHNGIDYIIYCMCDFLKIKKIFFHQTHIPNKFQISNNYNNYNKIPNRHKKKSERKLCYDNNVKKFFSNIKEPFYMKKSFFFNEKKERFYKYSLKYKLLRLLDFIRPSPERLIYRYLFFKKFIKFNINKKKNTFNLSKIPKKYIIFYLHFQPEGTSSFFGKIYQDQILAINKLSKIIPPNWKIIAKEHPRQHFLTRDSYFFSRLKLNKKIIYLENYKKIPEDKLIRNSKLIATISGTVANEAYFKNKKAILFGKSWISNAPGIYEFNKNINIKNILKFKITKRSKLNFEKKCLNFYDGVVGPEWDKNYKEFNSLKNDKIVAKSIYNYLKKL